MYIHPFFWGGGGSGGYVDLKKLDILMKVHIFDCENSSNLQNSNLQILLITTIPPPGKVKICFKNMNTYTFLFFLLLINIC